MAEAQRKTLISWIWAGIGGLAVIITIFVFFTGKNLPDWFPSSDASDQGGTSEPAGGEVSEAVSSPAKLTPAPQTMTVSAGGQNQALPVYEVESSGCTGDALDVVVRAPGQSKVSLQVGLDALSPQGRSILARDAADGSPRAIPPEGTIAVSIKMTDGKGRLHLESTPAAGTDCSTQPVLVIVKK